ncbi:MAG TPA: hypothetical protein ENG83_16135 [Nitrospirae bacterium]|nr:hypothetical protein [Nitrospirota bacterium]HDZ00763.1 hypothetical protein [Nitrospirota bacterium]
MEEKKRDNIWIISGGRPVNLDLSNICEEPVSGPVIEYEISELARYLLNPNPISLEEKIIGCKVYYSKPHSGKIRHLIRKIMRKSNGSTETDNPLVEEIISASKISAPAFKDKGLNAHFMKINELLRPYDPVHKKLAGLDTGKIDDIKAVCEDIGRNRYRLNLKGSINEKIDFVGNSLSKKTKVIFNKAYLLNGLFEMRGFNFVAFNANKSYRLIKFTLNDQTEYCVLNAGHELEYRIYDSMPVNYMHLFEQSVKTDPRLREALTLCIKGEATPLKLFFSKHPEKSYSENRLPLIYREVFSAYNISSSEKVTLANALNDFQSIVFFNYIPDSGIGKKKLFTNISVMHDCRALEPIKSRLPEVYSEINKKASVCDAGKLYLLDSLRGYQNV